ncbi:MAG: beta-galactosidase [Solirubrobacteraceae bacterium]
MSPSRRELTRRALLQRGALVTALVMGAPELQLSQALARGTRRYRSDVRDTFGTELEYYRSDPPHLEQRLALCVAAGYTTIQTYVPWNVHENTRGRLDFIGQTKPVILSDHADEYQIETPDQEVAAGGYESRVIANTDLLGFVKACQRHGLSVILRPGPFISDEWRNGGLPDWLAQAYPNMFMLGPHGTALEPGFPFSPPLASVTGGGPLFYFAGPSYASADYLREAKRWLSTFAKTMTPLLRSHGGPVVGMQVDDEICFYYRFGPFEVDYHPSMVARFGADPPTDWPAPGGPPSALRPALAWQRFKAGQLRVFLSAMADALRAGGADVPISHEEELQLAPPANFAQIAQAVDVLHPEFYLDPGPWSVPTIELCAAAVRGAQRLQRDVISAEMSGGDVFARHLLAGEGISGFLGFTYTDGIAEGDVPDMSVLGRTLRLAGPRLARSERIADTAIIWPPEYLYAPYDSTKYGFGRDLRGAIESDIPALATLLVRAGLAFDLLDTDVTQPSDYARYPTIWLACADSLPRSCQQALVSYVRGGGKLICWPAPPTLDENYAPCMVLHDALYGERLGAAYPEDNQTVRVLGASVQVWRGVQTFELSSSSKPIAWRGSQVCGYSRRVARGQAVLLGTWPVADSVPGRIGDVLESQDVPSGSGAAGAAVLARSLVARRWGAATATAINTAPAPDAGPPQKVLIFDYTNERRGGEVITGGIVAYWDGENVVPVSGINLGPTVPVLGTSQPEIVVPPFRPITPAHLAMAQRLHGRAAACAVTDSRIQARLLRARDPQGGTEPRSATISIVNRYSTDLRFRLTTDQPEKRTHVPLAGEMVLPAGEALLLPLEYELAPGVVVEQATVQLLDAQVTGRILRLAVSSPAGGEAVLQLPGPLGATTVDGRPAAVSHNKSFIKVGVGPGEHQLEVHWHQAKPERKRRSPHKPANRRHRSVRPKRA